MSGGLDGAVAAAWRALGGAEPLPARIKWAGPGGVLPAQLPVATLASASVAVCALAAMELAAARATVPEPAGAVTVDAGAVATAFVSERWLRMGDREFGSFAPHSRFWPAADGWVRTHGNYPHHRARLLTALRTTDQIGRAIAVRPAIAVEELVYEAGGLAVAMRTPQEWAAHPQGSMLAELPLLSLRRVVSGPARSLPPAPTGPLLPAAGVRVLDLTRVIAGPVATRILALLGADVLRVDSPRLPELEGQHLDTGFGKRSTLLDLHRHGDRAAFEELLSTADVVVSGYRPGALDRFGLAPEALRERRADLVTAQLSAWGPAGPWAHRRGFDSLVQAACGIAALEQRDDGTPGALPAQALDHATGYLLAAAVLRTLAQRTTSGGGWHAQLSLAQTAWWLVNGGLSFSEPGGGEAYDPQRWCAEVDSEVGRLRYALPPVTLPGGPRAWAHPPRRWGADPPTWQ